MNGENEQLSSQNVGVTPDEQLPVTKPAEGDSGETGLTINQRQQVNRLFTLGNSVLTDTVRRVLRDTPVIGGRLFTDTDGATITFDIKKAALHRVTLAGNRTLAVTNADVGRAFAVRLTQDGTGSRTVTWWSGISWAGGSAPTLTTTASKADWFGFIPTAAATYDGFIIGQNI